MSIISRSASPFVIPNTTNKDTQDRSQKSLGQNAFVTAKVIDFISDPKTLNSEKIEVIKKSVSNSALVNLMPINSIWCQIIEANRSDQHIAYPFFPSHLNFPVKPAEQVWVFYSVQDQVYYWVCRKPGDYVSDDVNYTHIDRIVNSPTIKGTPGTETNIGAKDAFNGIARDTNTFPQGKTDNINDKTSGVLFDDEKIVKNSFEYQTKFIQEAVPRIVRQPGDFIIQGSNNSSVVLGSSNNKPGRGIIDIVTGRALNNAPVTNSRNYQEVDKEKPASTDITGNINADAARIFLGMNENADANFQINIDGINKTESGSCIVLKSEQIRLVATKDIKITVGDTGAGIVIKPDGNIVIIPSATGVIKLGGEDANKAILCQDATEAIPGSVIAPPVISTAGGIIGSSAISGTGVFASKILVK